MAGDTARLDRLPSDIGGGGPQRSATADRWVSILVTSVFAAVPLASVVNFSFWGRSLGGVIWILMSALAAIVVVNARSLNMKAIRFGPMLAFLGLGGMSVAWTGVALDGLHAFGQFTAFGLTYMAVASTTPSASLVARAEKLAWIGLTIGGVVGLLYVSTTLFIETVEPRSLSISMAALFTVVTLRESRTSKIMLAGSLAFAVAAVTTSRTASVVILALLVMRLWSSTRSQLKAAALIMAGVIFMVVMSTGAFQERMYFYELQAGASFADRVNAVNTAGRTAVWPEILERCLETPILGAGMGSVNATMADLAGPRFAHPHNDYLRLFCDGGVIGLALFWTFILRVVFNPARDTPRTGTVLSSRETMRGAVMILICLALFSTTDNILIYIPYFMLPAAVVLGWHTSALQPRVSRGA